MKIEVNDNQTVFEIEPGDSICISLGVVTIEPDTTLGEVALSVVVPGDYILGNVARRERDD